MGVFVFPFRREAQDGTRKLWANQNKGQKKRIRFIVSEQRATDSSAARPKRGERGGEG